MRFTTRWAGMNSGWLCAWFIAHPTILAAWGEPMHLAMAPYDVTLPCGTSLAISKTLEKKSLFSSLLLFHDIFATG